MVEKLLWQYGEQMVLHNLGGEQIVRALLQPVTGKTERLAKLYRQVLGRENPTQYLYIGPVSPAPEAQGSISAGGREYRVRLVEQIQGAGETVYCWAMCVEKGGADQWGKKD